MAVDPNEYDRVRRSLAFVAAECRAAGEEDAAVRLDAVLERYGFGSSDELLGEAALALAVVETRTSSVPHAVRAFAGALELELEHELAVAGRV